jgi:hypothetical protein
LGAPENCAHFSARLANVRALFSLKLNSVVLRLFEDSCDPQQRPRSGHEFGCRAPRFQFLPFPRIRGRTLEGGKKQSLRHVGCYYAKQIEAW